MEEQERLEEKNVRSYKFPTLSERIGFCFLVNCCEGLDNGFFNPTNDYPKKSRVELNSLW